MFRFLKRHWVFVFLTLIVVPSVYFLFLPAFYEPHDLHHIADIYQMYRAMFGGQFPPRLGPDFIFGYGYPLFNYYYLLPFYLGAIFYAVLGSLTFSFKLVFILSAFLSVFGMYFFLREFFGKWSAAVGAGLFLYTPYRAAQMYVRGAMGEFLALSLLPIAAWQLVSLIKYPNNKRRLAVSSLILALFILSHNFLWVLTLPWIISLSFLISDKRNLKSGMIYILFSGILSLGISAYWWLPALIEQGMVSAVTPFPLIDHFPFIRQLVFSAWGYGSSVWGPGDGMSFQVGIVNWLAVFGLLILVVLKKIPKNKSVLKIAIWTVIGFAASLLMMNSRSYPLWKIMPFHDFIQFPWRLLLLTTFFSSIMAAVIVESLKKGGKILGGAIILGALILTFSYFRPSRLFYKTDDQYLARFFANRSTAGKKETVAPEYLQYSEDYLLLPKWTKIKPSGLPGKKIESADVNITQIVELTATKWRVAVNSSSGGVVAFNSIYFPGWLALIDGKKADIEVGKPYGQIEVAVEPGKHEVLFYWAETPLRKFADFISIVSLLTVILFFLKDGQRGNGNQSRKKSN